MFGLGWNDVKEAMNVAAWWNQQEINKGIAKSNQQQAEWNAQAQLLTLQAQSNAQLAQYQNQNSSNKLLWVAVIAGVGLAGFMVLRGK